MTNEQLFEATLATAAVVVIPPSLSPPAREALAARIAAIVRQQKQLAQKSAAILRPTGDIVVEESRITIPHEPAAPLQWVAPGPDASPSTIHIESIAWLADCGLAALQAASEVPLLHGGLHPGSWYQDESGRARLGDFGLAEALAGATGNSVVCERGGAASEGKVCGNLYRVESDDAAVRGEWIATWAAHEVKQGDRPNVKADQFALAAALFAVATRRHPYGVELSDPRASYYQIEPNSLLEHREDWRQPATRERAMIDTLDQTLGRALAGDAQARFARCADARANLRNVTPREWTEAAEAIAGGLRSLESGGADEFLRRTEKWVESEKLPSAWRARLAPLVSRVRTERDYQIRVRQAEQRVARAREAADLIDLPKARELLRPVEEDATLPEPLRAEARTVARGCDEQEQFMKSGADEVAQEYLEAARAALARREYDGVKAILHGVRGDPNTPPLRARQALELAGEAQICEERELRHAAVIRHAEEDFAARRYARTIGGLRELIAEPQVEPDVADTARKLLVKAEAEARRQAEVMAALQAAKEAWSAGDSAKLLSELARVPADDPDPAVLRERGELYGHLDRLRGVRGQIGAIRSLLEKGQLAGARRELETARSIGELPKNVAEELDGLTAAVNEKEAAAAARRRAQLAEQLAAAGSEFERGELDACEDRLERELLSQNDLTPELLEAARTLRARCGRAADAGATLANVEELAAEKRFSMALDRINGVSLSGLPAPLIERHASLLERVTAEWGAWREAQRERLREELKAVERALEEGAFDEARRGVQEVLGSDFADAELRKKATRFRAELETQPTILELLEQIEGLIERDEAAAEASMQQLPTQLRTWAAARRLAAQERLRELAEEREEERKRRITQSLARVPQVLAAGDLRTAREVLGSVVAELRPEDEAQAIYRKLQNELEHAEDWTRRLQAAQELVDHGRFTQAISRASDELQASNVPTFAANAFVGICDEAKRRIEERRTALMKQLNGLGAQLEARGRRIRHFERRLSELLRDEFATLEHRRKADELQKRFADLPETPTESRSPLGWLAGAAALVGVAAGAWYFWPRGETSPPTVNVNQNAVEGPLAASNANAGALAAANENAAAVAAANENAAAIAAANENVNENASAAIAMENANDAGPPANANENGDAPAIVVANENDEESLVVANENGEPPEIAVTNENGTAPVESQPVAINPTENANGDAGEPVAETPTNENGAAIVSDVPDSQPVSPPDAEPEPVESQPVAVATFAEAIEAFRGALLSDDASGLELTHRSPDAEGRFSIGGRWRGVGLLEYDDLEFDVDSGSIRPPAEVVRDWFGRQRTAIDGLDGCDWSVAPGYDDRLRRGNPPMCAVRGLDERGLLLAVRLSLDGDGRDGAGFDCPGYLNAAGDELVFAADDVGRAAFAGYLRGLQNQRRDQAHEAVAAALGLSRAQVLLTQDDEPTEENDYRIAMDLDGVRRTLGHIGWRAADLDYPVDAAALRAALDREVNAVLAEPRVADSLRASWRELIGGADALTDGAKRVIDGCEVVPIGLREERAGGAFEREATVRLKPALEGAAELTLNGRVRVDATTVGWDKSRAAEGKAKLLSQIEALARNPAFRAQCTADALATLATALKVEPEKLTVVREGPVLEVRVAGPPERRFEAKWSNVGLSYEAAREISIAPQPQPQPQPQPPVVTPPGASGTVAWSALAASGVLAPAQGADALRAAASAKLGSAAAGWSQASALQAAEPQARMVGVARGLQRLVASGAAAKDAVQATTFVEFVEAGPDVFAFGFKVDNGGDGLASGISASKVWRVCSSAELRQFGNGNAFREKYASDPAWGERLLGPMLSDGLRADASGSIGWVIAPTGPLWNVRWEQVRFAPKPVSGLRGERPPTQAISLRDLVGVVSDPRNPQSEKYRKAAIWCVPSLAARFNGGGAARLGGGGDFGGAAIDLAFEANAKQCSFATIRANAAGDFGWPNDKGSFTAQDIGYRFWNRRWTGNTFNQTQAISFALLPTGE